MIYGPIKKFRPKFFFTHIFFYPIFLPIFFLPNFFLPKFFLEQNRIWPKQISDPNFVHKKKIPTKFFWPTNFFDPNFFNPNFFLTQTNFRHKFFWPKQISDTNFFWPKKFWHKFFLDPAGGCSADTTGLAASKIWDSHKESSVSYHNNKIKKSVHYLYFGFLLNVTLMFELKHKH